MSISDFIYEFERLLNKKKQYELNMSWDILAYQVLIAANISEYYDRLVTAAIPELNYVMKTQLKKILEIIKVQVAYKIRHLFLQV